MGMLELQGQRNILIEIEVIKMVEFKFRHKFKTDFQQQSVNLLDLVKTNSLNKYIH